MRLFPAFFGLLFLGLAGTGCTKQDPTHPPKNDDTELITTVRLRFADSATGEVRTFEFSDTDGPGGLPPRQDTVKLQTGRTYTCEVSLLDETKTPVEVLSEEIRQNAAAHEMFWLPNVSALEVRVTDNDNGTPPRPLGLITRWKTNATGLFSVQQILKHQPGTKDGNPQTGETDLDIVWPVRVQ